MCNSCFSIFMFAQNCGRIFANKIDTSKDFLTIEHIHKKKTKKSLQKPSLFS